MARKKRYYNENRKQLGKLNKVREQLWVLGGIKNDIAIFGLIDDQKKMEQARQNLLEHIYSIERNLKLSIFDYENSHLS